MVARVLYVSLVALCFGMISIMSAVCCSRHHDELLCCTFGDKGKVLTNFAGCSDSACDAVALPDGTIVAVGCSKQCGNSNFALARYTSYGALHQCFGVCGKVLTDFSCRSSQSSFDCAFGVTLDHRCNIVVVGCSNATRSGRSAFALARYDENGCLDKSFNRSGMVITSIGVEAQARAVAMQKDGKIVVAGYARNCQGGTDFVVARYNDNGMLDKSFGAHGTGIVVTDFAKVICSSRCTRQSDDRVYALKIQHNGKIIVAGSSTAFGDKRHFAVARYTKRGRLDTSFGTKGTGVVITCGGGCNEEARALVLLDKQAHCSTPGSCARTPCTACLCKIDDDAAFVLVGYSNARKQCAYDFALAGYDAHGCVDATFGSCGTGWTMTDFATYGDRVSDDRAYVARLVIGCQAQSRIVVSGYSKCCKTKDGADFALASYTTQGLLDRYFGVNGMATIALTGESDDRSYALVHPGKDKVIAVGTSDVVGTSDFALVCHTIGCLARCRK